MSDHMRQLRLSVAIPALEALDDFDAGYYPEPQPFFGPVTAAFVGTATTEDLYLAQACVEAERELRRKEWAALEVLLGAIPTGGTIEDIYYLPPADQLTALRAAVACRWFRPGA